MKDEDEGQHPRYPSRVLDWYREWRPYWPHSRSRLLLWAMVAAGWRRPGRLWSWWVDEYVLMIWMRARIRRRVEQVGDR